MPPRRRHVGMVFQQYAVFPHMNVAANVAYVGVQGKPRTEIQQRVDSLLTLVGLSGKEKRDVTRLSGGQRLLLDGVGRGRRLDRLGPGIDLHARRPPAGPVPVDPVAIEPHAAAGEESGGRQDLPREVRAADVGDPAAVGPVKDVGLGVEARLLAVAAGLDDPEVSLDAVALGEVAEPGQRLGIGEVEVVAGEEPEPAVPLEHLLEVGEDRIEARLAHEGGGHVGPDGLAELLDEVLAEGVVPAGDDAPPVGRRARAGLVGALPGDDVPDAAAGIADVAPVAGDDVDVEDGLAGGLADVDADGEAVGAVRGLDGGPRVVDAGQEGEPLGVGRLEPGRHAAPGDDERVPRGDREGVPEAPGRPRSRRSGTQGQAREADGAAVEVAEAGLDHERLPLGAVGCPVRRRCRTRTARCANSWQSASAKSWRPSG